MSNRLYRSDYNGYYFAKSDLSGRGNRDWAYDNLPQEICTLTEDEKDLEEYMEQKRDLMVSCSIRCPYKKPIFPPTQAFVSQKEFILQNDLFCKVFHKMPKGGLLHVHGLVALSAERLIDLMLVWNKKVQDKSRQIEIVDQPVPGMEYRYAVGTLLYKYQSREVTEHMIPLHEYLKRRKKRKKLVEMLSLRGKKGKSTSKIWEEINIIASRTVELFKDREFYTCYYETFFEECIEDRIRYVEIRCDFEKFTEPEKGKWQGRCKEYSVTKALYFKDVMTDVDPGQPDGEFIDAILEALRQVRRRFRNITFNAKVILSAQRSLNPYVKTDREILCKRIDAAIALKEYYMKRGREVVIGFDFVGMEDGNSRMDHYARKIIYRPVGYGYKEEICEAADEKLRIEKIDFFMHAGESNWYFNDNLAAAAIISKYRIGHGFNMNRMSEVMQGIIEGPAKLIVEPVLEICPICDQSLGYCKDIRRHPAYEYMKNGIMCAVANDSPQILGNPGVSFDLWEAYVGMGLTLKMIKMLVFITYLYEFTTYSIKRRDIERAKAEFKHDWNDFMEEMKKII